MPTPRLAVLLAASLALAACGDPPRRTPAGPSGTPPAAQAPAPGLAAGGTAVRGEPIELRGSVRLVGSYAQAQSPAALFVSLRPRGEGPDFPILSVRVDLGAEGATVDPEGARSLPFVLTGADAMGTGAVLDSAQLPPAYDLEALFDPTGGLTDKEALVRRRLPIDGHDLDGLVIEFAD